MNHSVRFSGWPILFGPAGEFELGAAWLILGVGAPVNFHCVRTIEEDKNEGRKHFTG
jgi:hypothetical protein